MKERAFLFPDSYTFGDTVLRALVADQPPDLTTIVHHVRFCAAKFFLPPRSCGTQAAGFSRLITHRGAVAGDGSNTPARLFVNSPTSSDALHHHEEQKDASTEIPSIELSRLSNE